MIHALIDAATTLTWVIFIALLWLVPAHMLARRKPKLIDREERSLRRWSPRHGRTVA